MDGPSVKHVVVDSGAFINNAPLKDIGESLYTLREVVSEIRDKATRQRLQVLPYDLVFREPSSESIRTVTDFAKKTGDYPSLSAVDIRVMALVYQLEKEHVGTDHIRLAPLRNATWTSTTRHLQNPTEIAGFYINKKKSPSVSSSRTTSECQSETSQTTKAVTGKLSATHISNETPLEDAEMQDPIAETQTDVTSETSKEESKCDVENKVNIEIEGSGCEDHNETSIAPNEGQVVRTEDLQDSGSEQDDDDDEDDDDDDDDNDGWITPSNIKKVQETMTDPNLEKASVAVGCLTTDFAMQNVLIQMGLNVVAVNGMLIKRARSYVLRCFACFKITNNMMREFCFHCGNKTLQKVSMTVEEDGSIRYFLSRRKLISTKGMKYSLPAPKGGKHAVNPVLVADQKLPHQRPSGKAKGAYDVFDPDYEANASPFAPVDTHSRYAQLGLRNKHGRSKRNPNENKRVYGRRK